MMYQKNKSTDTMILIDKLYNILAAQAFNNAAYNKTIPIIAEFCIKLHPIYNDNQYYKSLFEYVTDLLSAFVPSNNEDEPKNILDPDADVKRNKLLSLFQNFAFSLLKNAKFHIYLYNCKEEIPFNSAYEQVVTVLPESLETFDFLNPQYNGENSFLILIYDGQLPKQVEILKTFMDFCFEAKNITDTINVIINDLGKNDYYWHDKLYLSAKLESLKNRQDIQLLLAGSSYTMCGLFEDQMPVPARNVAVDAQDLYYTLKTIRTALDYNSNIKYCIISFAYYFWGYDLSLSTSLYQYKRITKVNYPVFKDKHNFSGETDDDHDFLNCIPPLRKSIFDYKIMEEKSEENCKKSFADSHYFSYPRIGSAMLDLDEGTNRKRSQERTASHNKFFKYLSTVNENQKLFEQFLIDMNRCGVQILAYVPPLTEFYRDSLNPQLKIDFYSYMDPLLKKYEFKLIDLSDSNIFKNDDFFDYDHLNDRGAKKMGKILIQELGLQ